MRFTVSGLLLTLILGSAGAAETPATIYSPDPDHLWNRLYRAMAIRTLDGVQYGADISEPYPDDFDSHERLIAALDEFLRTQDERSLSDPLARALLLNDAWTAFDTAARSLRRDDELLKRLAWTIDRLRIPAWALAQLEDNYAAAVRSGTFAKDFDPARPEVVFLPPDLFDPEGPWVQVGENGLGLTAPTHVQMVSGRSVFQMFIRCPGGRAATLSYLQRLNLHPTPWRLNTDSTGTCSPDDHPCRGDVLYADPNTPQFPEGAVVALVRRMMTIDANLQPIVTPITQKVQLRVYRKVRATDRDAREAFRQTQSAYEFVMRRRALITGVAGGLQAVSATDHEYQLLLRPMVTGDAAYFSGPIVLDTCRVCHAGAGVFSVRSYAQMFFGHERMNPQLLPANAPDTQGWATADWKKAQFDWGMLQGILAMPRGR